MDEIKLNVFDIERFAIHDGPGIRTTVFLKGCPLRCAWCANPESQSAKPELMHAERKCVGCGRCANACKHGAVKMADGRPVFDRAKCVLCGDCVRACLSGALKIAGRAMAVDEILRVVLRDRTYYQNSGGGVTVSGGEPFAQPQGLFALLSACKEAGLSTAVETCGDVAPEVFARSFGLADLYLFDIKHADAEKLRQMTGGGLPRILQNLAAAAQQSTGNVVVRVPVIPGFNFDEASINAIFGVALQNGVQQVHLLPYHTLGSGKYPGTGRGYTLARAKALRKEELAPYKKMGEAMGLRVKLGG